MQDSQECTELPEINWGDRAGIYFIQKPMYPHNNEWKCTSQHGKHATGENEEMNNVPELPPLPPSECDQSWESSGQVRLPHSSGVLIDPMQTSSSSACRQAPATAAPVIHPLVACRLLVPAPRESTKEKCIKFTNLNKFWQERNMWNVQVELYEDIHI